MSGFGGAGDIDHRLPPPPIPFESLHAYITTVAHSTTQLATLHTGFTRSATSLSDTAGWIGDDSDAFQRHWSRLTEEHVRPTLGAMRSIHEHLTQFYHGLRAVGEEATQALHLADRHLQIATEMENAAQVQLREAQMQLMLAEEALQAAIAADAASLGMASAAVAAAQMAVAEAQMQVQAAQAQVEYWQEQQQQARQEQERAKEQARMGYQTHDQRTAGELMGVHVPQVPLAQAALGALPQAITGASSATGAALQGSFAQIGGAFLDSNPVGMPQHLVGQPSVNTCLATGIQNFFTPLGIPVDANEIAPLLGTSGEGAYYHDAARAMNAIARQGGLTTAENAFAFREGVTLDDLRSITGQGLQVMVPVRTEIGGLHNVNIYGIEDRMVNGQAQPFVRFFDSMPEPSGEAVEAPLAQFTQMWDRQRAIVPTL